MKRLLKYSLIGLLLLVVGVIVAVPFIPAEKWRPEIEAEVSAALGMQTSLGDISLISLPKPGLKVTNIRMVRDGTEIATAESLQIVPKLSSLFSDSPELRQLLLKGIRIRPEHIAVFIPSEEAETKDTDGPSLFIHRISAENSYLIVEQDALPEWGPLKFEVRLDREQGFAGFELTHEVDSVKLDIRPDGENLAINLQAGNWPIAVYPKLTLSSLNASGHILADRLQFDTVKASAYEGTVNGNLTLGWAEQWSLNSQLKVASLNSGALLKALDNHSLDGTASGNFIIRAQDANVGRLAETYRITGDFQVVNGNFYEVDLEQAARSFSKEWKVGGQTPFDEIKSHLDMDAKQIKLTKLALSSSILGAEGGVKIKQMQDLDGEISVGIKDSAGLLTMPLLVSGTVDEPRVRPTDAALAGAATGTVLLGPGVGTAVGVKAGEFMGKIGSLFGGDDDDEKEPEKK